MAIIVISGLVAGPAAHAEPHLPTGISVPQGAENSRRARAEAKGMFQVGLSPGGAGGRAAARTEPLPC